MVQLRRSLPWAITATSRRARLSARRVKNSSKRIDTAGHLGGLVGGLLLGWLCFRQNERWINKNEKLVNFGGAAALVALAVIAAFAVNRLWLSL